MGDDTPKADLIQKDSHNVLHATTPSENLAIPESANRSEEVVKRVHSFGKRASENHAKKEEIAEKPSRGKGAQSEEKILQGSPSSEKTAQKTPTPQTSTSSPPYASETTSRSPGSSNRNAKTYNSEIISPQDESNVAASIFSVSGAPSRKVYHKRQRTPNNVFPTDDPPYEKPNASNENNKKEQKRPSSSVRNPLTGIGLTSNDEYKFNKTVKRRDGNPLLGIGYTPETPHSSHRIPPGGYSHKLW